MVRGDTQQVHPGAGALEELLRLAIQALEAAKGREHGLPSFRNEAKRPRHTLSAPFMARQCGLVHKRL